MNELFYKAVRLIGGLVFRVASRPLVLHRERAARPGGYLLAANHESEFDAPLLIAVTPRVIYWLSIVEIFRHPLARWFLSAMLAAPLDRSRVDTRTVRVITRHLRAGRAVGVFPEGGVRAGGESILGGGGEIKEGTARLAQLAGVPVLPCVVVGSGQFRRWSSWLPLFRTRWAVAFGEPIFLARDRPPEDARDALTAALTRALGTLHQEIQQYV